MSLPVRRAETISAPQPQIAEHKMCIRDRVADGLEEMGFLEKPEASRTRVPTQAGVQLGISREERKNERGDTYPVSYTHLRALDRRHEIYNETLDFIRRLERDGTAVVIAPSLPVEISRFEKDLRRLESLYKSGMLDAQLAMRRLHALK